MPAIKHIQSKDNPFFKQLQKKDRAYALLEGEHLAQSWWQQQGQGGLLLLAASKAVYFKAYQAQADQVWILEDRLMKGLSSMPTPAPLMLKVPIPSAQVPQAIQENSLVLDGVQDPGNVGTLLRCAAAAGISQVFLSKDCANPWSAKVLRSAQGAHFVLNIHGVESLAEVLQNSRIPVVGTLLDPTASSLYKTDLSGPVIWVFGNEGQGIRDELKPYLTQGLYIPQAAGVESLNVAMAAAICLFEQRRQQEDVY